MAQYTMQEAFDLVWQHANRMEKQSRGIIRTEHDTFEACLYRSDDGGKCFAGVLIKDDEYKEILEGTKASFLTNIIKIDGVPSMYAQRFLDDIQQCHDANREKSRWLNELRRVAANYRLKCPED